MNRAHELVKDSLWAALHGFCDARFKSLELEAKHACSWAFCQCGEYAETPGFAFEYRMGSNYTMCLDRANVMFGKLLFRAITDYIREIQN